MFCPRCSQEQVSDEQKFCSRCGLPLDMIAEVLANGSLLPQLAELPKSKKFLTRRKGLLFSLVWFMIFSMILTPIFGGVAHADALALACAIMGAMGGLILLIASFVVLKNEPKIMESVNKEIPNYRAKNLYQPQQPALPTQQSQSAQSYVSPANSWKASDTSEFAQPQSITENTTKLLEKDKSK